MKRLIITMVVALSAIASLSAKPKTEATPFDISEIAEFSDSWYVELRKPLIQNSNALADYNISPEMAAALDKVQIAIVPSSQSSTKARNIVHACLTDFEKIMTIKGSRSNISVWVLPKNRNSDVYSKTVIGIGTYGKLTYILLDGDISAAQLGEFINDISR